MKKRFGAFPAATLLAVAGMPWLSEVALAERVLARYEGLTAVIGDNHTCGANVPITVRAGDKRDFEGQRLDLQKLVGGLAAALGFECPGVSTMSITGMVDGTTRFNGTAAASEGWRLRPTNAQQVAQSSECRAVTETVNACWDGNVWKTVEAPPQIKRSSTQQAPASAPMLDSALPSALEDMPVSKAEGGFPCEAKAISELEAGARREGISPHDITQALFDARYNPPIELFYDVHRALHDCAAEIMGISRNKGYDNKAGFRAAKAWIYRYGPLPEERIWEILRRMGTEPADQYDSYAAAIRNPKVVEKIQRARTFKDAYDYVGSGVPALSYTSKRHVDHDLQNQKWDRETNLTARYLGLREQYLLKSNSPRQVAAILQREHYTPRTIRDEEQTKETQITKQIEAAKSGDDAFANTDRLIAPKLRLMHRGQFEALASMIRQEGHAVKNGSGAGLMVGLLGGIMPGLDGMVNQSIENARYGGLMMQYVFAKMETVGLCGERGIRFSGGNNIDVTVPASFRDIANAMQIWRADSQYAAGLRAMIVEAGGCTSPLLSRLEANMVSFWSWKPSMPEPTSKAKQAAGNKSQIEGKWQYSDGMAMISGTDWFDMTVYCRPNGFAGVIISSYASLKVRKLEENIEKYGYLSGKEISQFYWHDDTTVVRGDALLVPIPDEMNYPKMPGVKENYFLAADEGVVRNLLVVMLNSNELWVGEHPNLMLPIPMVKAGSNMALHNVEKKCPNMLSR